MNNDPSRVALSQVVESFWETFPPFWQHVRAHIRLVVEQYDISAEQFHILRHIRNRRNTVSELAQAKNISRPAISQFVEALVQKGYVTRTTDLHDRRQSLLALTGPGNSLLDAIFDDIHQWMQQAFSPLSDEELILLVQAMKTIQKIQPV